MQNAEAPRGMWVESDAYDRSAFRRLAATTPSLRALLTSGANLLPHFESFLLDLFALLFKMNIVMRPAELARASAGFYRAMIEELVKAPVLAEVREQTVLDEVRAGIATALLGERLLELIKSERLITRREMLDYWNLEQQLTEVEAREADADSAALLARHASAAGKRQLRMHQGRLDRELNLLRRRAQRTAEEVQSRCSDGAVASAGRVTQQLLHVQRELGEAGDQAQSWGRQLGGGGRLSAGQQIELGKRLASNPKLRRLAQMIGRMREQARALRRTMFERANEEVFSVGLGRELSHLLPQELLALRHPLLRADFARRFLEAELFQYALRGPDTRGRGPMVVCLDVSSSMAGDKEIWSKAVALTLLDIARRQRRGFRSICFSSADTPLQVLELNRWGQFDADLPQVLALAEYFAGGGTDFQQPLGAALQCLSAARYRRGDVVLITDGECRVEAGWLAEFQAAKARLGFAVLSVLIDVGPASVATVREFSDKVATVSGLTGDAAGEIFLRF